MFLKTSPFTKLQNYNQIPGPLSLFLLFVSLANFSLIVLYKIEFLVCKQKLRNRQDTLVRNGSFSFIEWVLLLFFFFECVCVWARVLVVRNRRPSRDWGSDVIQKLMDVAHLYSPPVPTYTLLSSSCFVFFPVGNAPTHARTCNDDIPHYD